MLKYYYFHSNCVVEKGYNFSIIIDLFTYRYKRLPTEFLDFIVKNQFVKFQDIKKELKGEKFKLFHNFINELYQEDYISISDIITEKMLNDWDNTVRDFSVQSGIVRINKNSDFIKAFDLISKSTLKNLFVEIEIEEVMYDVLNHLSLKFEKSNIKFISLKFNFKLHLEDKLVSIIKKNKRISNIFASNFQNIKLSKDVKNVNFNLVNSDSRDVNIFVNHALYNRKKNNVGSEKIIIDEKGSISISNN